MAVAVYDLYERAVQSPERDVELIERAFERRAGRDALSLREDFAGTAALSRAWVESDPDRTALAVDHDASVLELARELSEGLLDEERVRLRFRCGDAREPDPPEVDVVTAMNFSWAVLEDEDLVTYLRAAGASLVEDGAVVLEHFGGDGLRTLGVDEHPGDGFTYRFERRAFDGTHLDARIHFQLDDGTELRDAFTYRFVLRDLEHVEALAARAGLTLEPPLIEDRRGRYRRSRGRPRRALYRALLLLSRSTRSTGSGSTTSSAISS